MSFTVTINLPDELAAQFVSQLPEEERNQFSVAAIADALRFRQEEDCVTVVEQALADMDAGIGLISFEEVCRRWDAEKAARSMTDSQ